MEKPVNIVISHNFMESRIFKLKKNKIMILGIELKII